MGHCYNRTDLLRKQGKEGAGMVKKSGSAPTMKDVAREAGVSLGTVSKVFNDIPVGDDYRRRVREAADRLGYTVNSYARGLKTNQTYCVALLLPSLQHPFFAFLADEIIACLTHRGYRCILMITNFDPKAEKKCFAMVRQNKADGVIALTYSPDLEVDESLPIVTIDRHLGLNIPCVSSDNYLGGQMAAEKLLELGCKKLLCLHIGDDTPGEPHKRSAGFEDYCRLKGAERRSLLLKNSQTEAPVYRFLSEHMHNGKLDHDGIFCTSDGLAVRVGAYLAGRGVRVPEDVQIIGYDGIVDYATGRYACSTIVQPVPQMAEMAVNLLLNDSRRATGASVCLPVRFAPGGTTRGKKE